MKSLTLNIDLEYIRAVISTPNDEYSIVKTGDRDSVNCFWLYFYIDQFNKRIQYKKSYHQRVLDKVPGYIGYSFPNQRDFENEKVLFDNHNYYLTELLGKSGIIGLLRSHFDEKDEEIPTYIVYSTNINPRNKEVLNQYLINQGFNIISYVLPLPELYCFKYRKELKEQTSKDIVFIKAVNKDLNLSHLSLNGDIFMRSKDGQKLLVNKGVDPRARTLVEYVVSQLSRETNFLRTKEKQLIEIERLSRNATNWLDRLNCIECLILEDITLSNCKRTKYRVRIDKESVEEETGVYIRELITEFRHFIRDNIESGKNYLLILLGESLNNQFIKKRFIEEVGEDRLQIGKTSQLIEVLAVYKDAYECFQNTLNQEEIKNRHNVAVSSGDSYLSERKYEQSKSSYLEAKNLLNSDEVKAKLEYVNELIKKEIVKVNDFNLLKKEVEKLIEEERFHIAIAKLDDALELFPDDNELIQRRNTLTLQIQALDQKAKNLFKEAQSFFKNNKYSEAKLILGEILKKDSNNSGARNLSNECDLKLSIIKLLQKANDHFIKLEFEIALTLYKQGFPDEVCKSMAVKCKKLIPLFEDFSKTLMIINGALKNENLDLASIHLQKCDKTILQIKEIDSNLEYEDLVEEFKRYKKEHSKKQDFIYQNYVKKADEFYNSKNYSEAEKQYNKVLELNSNDEYCLKRLGEIKSAKEIHKGKKIRYEYLLGEAKKFKKDKDFFSAEKYLKEANKCCPKENEAINILDKISFVLMELNKDYKSYLKRGKESYEDKVFDKAYSYFKKAYDIKPQEKELNSLIKDCEFKIKFSENSSILIDRPRSSGQKDEINQPIPNKESDDQFANHKEQQVLKAKDDSEWNFGKEKNTNGSKKGNKDQLKSNKESNDQFNFGKPNKKKPKDLKEKNNSEWEFEKEKKTNEKKENNKDFNF